MADFPEKDWRDRPDYSTPINAAALEDMERRLSEYAASEVASLAATVGKTIEAGDTPSGVGLEFILIDNNGVIELDDITFNGESV